MNIVYIPTEHELIDNEFACLHASTEREEIGAYHDPSETELAEICTECNKIYNEWEGTWHE